MNAERYDKKISRKVHEGARKKPLYFSGNKQGKMKNNVQKIIRFHNFLKKSALN